MNSTVEQSRLLFLPHSHTLPHYSCFDLILAEIYSHDWLTVITWAIAAQVIGSHMPDLWSHKYKNSCAR